MNRPYVVKDFSQRPLLVFWETTRACGLSCVHCRAEAIEDRDPYELTTEEGLKLIRSIKDFGPPYPVLILTGGDLLIRPDLDELIAECTANGLRFAVSPSVTPLLNKARMKELHDLGARALSISLDGANARTHDGIRQVDGTFDESLVRLKEAVDLGMRVQVNTAVMRSNVEEMADIFHLIRELGVKIWEVFFLIQTGRGAEMEDIEPWEYEEVSHFLFETSKYGVQVRTTEAPFFRRVAEQRLNGATNMPEIQGELLGRLQSRLVELAGPPTSEPLVKGVVTGDGRGIVFINHQGFVYPSGYLDLPVNNVRARSLPDIYRHEEVFVKLRQMENFGGRCGICEYRDMCGGSRARAYAHFEDPMAEDPACVYQPSGQAEPRESPAPVGG